MRPIFQTRTGVFLVLFLLVGQATYGAELKEKLEGLKRRITREKRGISEVERKEGSVLEALDKIEIELDRRNKRLKSLSSKLDGIVKKLQKTEKQLLTVSRSVHERQEYLKKRARALYLWQRGT